MPRHAFNFCIINVPHEINNKYKLINEQGKCFHLSAVLFKRFYLHRQYIINFTCSWSSSINVWTIRSTQRAVGKRDKTKLGRDRPDMNNQLRPPPASQTPSPTKPTITTPYPLGIVI